MSAPEAVGDHDRIAIIGMAGRFPGAPDVAALWRLSVTGLSGLTRVALDRPGFVGVRGVIETTDQFDAALFGIPEHEAALIDPQQRVLLEVAQHALDDAGLDATSTAAAISAYMACAPSVAAEVSVAVAEHYDRELARSPEFAATRLSYRLGLRGESITVQTACSSSLVAVHLAAQSLLMGQSDIALAGGVSLPPNQDVGYAVEDGMIASPSGACRPFDAAADGAVPGAGAAIVVLKRLIDARRDGDRVLAVILGSAVNNDGSSKVGFMAPSPTGQSEAIAAAHSVAGVPAGSIGYIETHGTATQLGDAAEIEGLRRAFALDTNRRSVCRLGSLKANCGHLDRAAGVAGLIRTVQVLRHRIIPPMAGFTQANPVLALHDTAFEVPTQASPWPDGPIPRRAGVSAFGIGGTNAHVIVEEAPASTPAGRADNLRCGESGESLLLLSAHTPAVMAAWAASLAESIAAGGEVPLADLAGTLARDRTARRYRSWAVARDAAEAIDRLRSLPPVTRNAAEPSVVFAFPGQGERLVDGLPSLYATEALYRDAIDHCAEVIHRLGGFDIRDDLFSPLTLDERTARFADMARFQPSLFAVEWALATVWKSWGVRAHAVLGHSVGEITAAVHAGVLDVDDGLAFVVERSRLMELTPPGATLTVGLPADNLAALLPADVEIAARNGRELTAVTGPIKLIEDLAGHLVEGGVFHRRLNIRHSPHGSAMTKTADTLGIFLERLPMSASAIRIASNVTGDWAGDEIATPRYWATQLRSPVRFADDLDRVAALPQPVVLVVGPGVSFTRMIAHEIGDRALAVVASDSREDGSRAGLLDAAGQLWSTGIRLDLDVLCPPPRRRAILPPTVFDHSTRWPTPVPPRPAVTTRREPCRHDDPGAWLYEPQPRALPAAEATHRDVVWLGDGAPVRAAALAAARAAGRATTSFADLPDGWRPSPGTDLLWAVDDIDHLLPAAASLACRIGTAGDIRVLMIVRADTHGELLSGPSVARAAAQVVPQETPGAQWLVVTVPSEAAQAERSAAHLASVLAQEHPPTIITLTADGVSTMELRHAWPDWRTRPLREHGCYVITGGAGRVGRAMTASLCREVPASVVLLGRRSPDSVATELSRLRMTAATLSSTVHYRQLDVTDGAAVRDCLDQLRDQHGRIDGVVHAAGFTDRSSFVLASDAGPEQLHRIGAAKILGAQALAAALTPDDADFVLLCSSLSVVLGGLRFGPYVAANAWLEEFATAQHTRGDRRWLSVAWDSWTDHDHSGIPHDEPVGPARFALDDDDGYEVLRRVLSCRGPLVYVSTAELSERTAEVAAQLTGDAHHSRQRHRTPGELVRDVLSDVLGSVPADPSRDLRLDGIESLAILQIVTRLRTASGASVPLADVLRHLTVAGLTDLVTHRGKAPGAIGGAFRVTKAGEATWHPTSSIQRRWLELLPQGYGGIDLVVDIAGPVTSPQLHDALQRTLERHSGLRTIFRHDTDGGWSQSIVRVTPPEVIDLTHLPDPQQRTELGARAAAAAHRWFDVTREPPFETTLARLAPDRHALLIHAHHVLFDGWSSSIFLRDLALAIRTEPLQPALQYIDYAHTQSRYLTGPGLLRAREYWRQVFDGAPEPTRLAPQVDDVQADDRGCVLEFVVPAAALAQLRRRAVDLSTTLFALMMAAYVLLVHRYTGHDDIIVGTTAAGRPSSDTEDIVGVFVNPLPLRLSIDNGASIKQFVAHVHQALVDFHEFGHYPMEDLVASVPPFVGMGLNDTFHCYLLYQNYWRPETDTLRFAPLRLPGDDHYHKLMRDWEIVLTDTSNGLTGELWYRAARLSEDWAHRCLAEFPALLEVLAQVDTDLPLGSLG